MTLPTNPYEQHDLSPTRVERDAEAQHEYEQMRAAVAHVEAASVSLDEAIKSLEQAHRVTQELGFGQIASMIRVLALGLEMTDTDTAIDALEDIAPR